MIFDGFMVVWPINENVIVVAYKEVHDVGEHVIDDLYGTFGVFICYGRA